MSAGNNNPILIERQLEVLNDFKKEVNKTVDTIRENVNYLDVISDKVLTSFYDNYPINAQKILSYIDEISDNLEEIDNDSNFKYFLQQLEELDKNVEAFNNYFNNYYLKTMEQNN